MADKLLISIPVFNTAGTPSEQQIQLNRLAHGEFLFHSDHTGLEEISSVVVTSKQTHIETHLFNSNMIREAMYRVRALYLADNQKSVDIFIVLSGQSIDIKDIMDSNNKIYRLYTTVLYPILGQEIQWTLVDNTGIVRTRSTTYIGTRFAERFNDKMSLSCDVPIGTPWIVACGRL